MTSKACEAESFEIVLKMLLTFYHHSIFLVQNLLRDPKMAGNTPNNLHLDFR